MQKKIVTVAKGSGKTAEEKRKYELMELRQSYCTELAELSAASKTSLLHACSGNLLSASAGDSADRREPDDILLRNKIGITTQKRITNIKAAIELIDSGQYGDCESCGKEIPIGRLRLAAGTTFCVSCKEEEDRSKTIRRPGSSVRIDNLQPRHFAQ